MKRTGVNRLSTLEEERNNGSFEPVSEITEDESASEILGERKGKNVEGTILSR
jgi:hypothetical protein